MSAWGSAYTLQCIEINPRGSDRWFVQGPLGEVVAWFKTRAAGEALVQELNVEYTTFAEAVAARAKAKR